MDFFAVPLAGEPDEGAGLVDDIDGLVRQEAVVEVLGRQLAGGLQGGVHVDDAVVLFVARAQALEDLDALVDGGLGELDFLEAPGQGTVFFKMVLVLFVGGGADAADLAAGQNGLEDVGGIHGAAGGGAGAHYGVDLVDEQDHVVALLQFLDDTLEALLEVPPELGSGQHARQVQRVDLHFAQDVRHVAVEDFLHQALGHGGFAHPRVAHEHRVVLAPPAKHLHGALHFGFAADERVQLALGGQRHHVHGVLFQGVGLFLFGLAVLVGARKTAGIAVHGVRGHFVGDVVEHVQARNTLLGEEKGGVGIFFHENGGQDIAHRHLGFFSRPHVIHGPLDHPLKADGLLQDILVPVGDDFHFFPEKIFEAGLELFDVAAAPGFDDFQTIAVVQYGIQDMFDAHIFMAAALGLPHGES